jgi:alkylation response protein AidB-like acyl-CoA dehydrogenase
MAFILTEEQTMLRDLARKSTTELIAPIVAADEESGTFRPEIIAQLGQRGLTGIPVPEALDGAGLGYLEYAIALEEIATSSAAYAISVAVSGLPQVILSQYGTDTQKKKYIPPLARGEHIGAFALSESGSGSDAGALKTKATKKGNQYILNGTKMWCTQGNVANTLIIFARTGAEGPKGVSAFILEKGTKGFRVGKREHKMGAHISPTCELILEDVALPSENLVGQEGDGFKIAMTALDSGRITIAAIAVGVARAAGAYATQFARERKQFGTAIADFQGIQFMLADIYAQVQASRLLVHKAATLKDTQRPFSLEASAAKLYATDAAMSITTNAVQVLGGVGYTREYPVERYMREAKVLQIVEGTNQIQRLVIGRALAKGANPWD